MTTAILSLIAIQQAFDRELDMAADAVNFHRDDVLGLFDDLAVNDTNAPVCIYCGGSTHRHSHSVVDEISLLELPISRDEMPDWIGTDGSAIGPFSEDTFGSPRLVADVQGYRPVRPAGAPCCDNCGADPANK